MFQSRAIACRGCPSANKDCKFVRCPHCDSHFPIDGTLVNSKEKGHFMSNYMNSIVNNYYNSFGKVEKR